MNKSLSDGSLSDLSIRKSTTLGFEIMMRKGPQLLASQ